MSATKTPTLPLTFAGQPSPVEERSEEVAMPELPDDVRQKVEEVAPQIALPAEAENDQQRGAALFGAYLKTIGELRRAANLSAKAFRRVVRSNVVFRSKPDKEALNRHAFDVLAPLYDGIILGIPDVPRASLSLPVEEAVSLLNRALLHASLRQAANSLLLCERLRERELVGLLQEETADLCHLTSYRCLFGGKKGSYPLGTHSRQYHELIGVRRLPVNAPGIVEKAPERVRLILEVLPPIEAALCEVITGEAVFCQVLEQKRHEGKQAEKNGEIKEWRGPVYHPHYALVMGGRYTLTTWKEAECRADSKKSDHQAS